MPYRLAAFLWLTSLTLLHLWMIGSGLWPLSADEAHYWEWARRLDWSYYSKPPLVAYLIAAGTAVGGASEFWVRLPAVLIGLGLAGIAYILTLRIFLSERAAFFAVVILSVMPLYAVGSMLMTIDPPFVFFWGLTWLCLYRVTQRPSATAWYATGVALGLGLLTKPVMFMLFPCAAGWLASTPRLRHWFRHREPYEAAAVALLLFSPVIVWNARYGWLSFRHVATQAGPADGRSVWAILKGGPEFVATQLGVASPILFVLFVVAVTWAWREGARAQRPDLLLLAWASGPVFLFFLAWSFVAKVQANWAAHAYFTAAIATAGWYTTRTTALKFRRHARRLNRIMLLSIMVPACILPIAFAPDLMEAVGLKLPAALDLVSKRLRGWPELGQAVGETMRVGSPTSFLMSDRYQIASQLAFYTPGNPRVYNPNFTRRMNQYDIWGGWEDLKGKDGYFVTYGAGEPPEPLRAAFREVSRVRVVPILHRGQHLRDFSIFLGREFQGFPPRPFEGY
jgi:undecaprenyl-diphosphatase